MGRAFDKFNEIEKESEGDELERKVTKNELKIKDIKPIKVKIPKEKEVRIQLDHQSFSDPDEDIMEEPEEAKDDTVKSNNIRHIGGKMDTLAPSGLPINPLRMKEGEYNPRSRQVSVPILKGISTQNKSKSSKTGKSKLFGIAKKFLKKKDEDEGSRIEDMLEWK